MRQTTTTKKTKTNKKIFFMGFFVFFLLNFISRRGSEQTVVSNDILYVVFANIKQRSHGSFQETFHLGLAVGATLTLRTRATAPDKLWNVLLLLQNHVKSGLRGHSYSSVYLLYVSILSKIKLYLKFF